MIDANMQYVVISTNIAVPVSKLESVVASVIPMDYDYDDGVKYRPRGDGLADLKIISGEQLLANQVAYRLKQENKK